MKGLQATACLWPPLQRAYDFIHQAAQILANDEQETGTQVRERYLRYVAQMQEQKATLGPLAEAIEHFCHKTSNFAGGRYCQLKALTSLFFHKSGEERQFFGLFS